MSFTLTTSATAVYKAGLYANSTIIADTTFLNKIADETEGFLCNYAKYDFVTNYSSLTTVAKNFLSEVASAMIATRIIDYDDSGFYSLASYQTKLNVLDDTIQRGLKMLSDRDTVKFMTT